MAADSPATVGADIQRSLGHIARNVKQATRDIAKEGAKVSREELRATAARSTGGDRKFSNFKGPALDVAARYDPGGVTIRPKGPWKIAEEGADPHIIKPKNKSKTLRIGGAIRQGTVKHPGTRGSQGRKAWTRGRDNAIDRLDVEAKRIADKAVEDGFRA